MMILNGIVGNPRPVYGPAMIYGMRLTVANWKESRAGRPPNHFSPDSEKRPRCYPDNPQWVRHIKNGEYMKWMQEHYQK